MLKSVKLISHGRLLFALLTVEPIVWLKKNELKTISNWLWIKANVITSFSTLFFTLSLTTYCPLANAIKHETIQLLTTFTYNNKQKCNCKVWLSIDVLWLYTSYEFQRNFACGCQLSRKGCCTCKGNVIHLHCTRHCVFSTVKTKY